MLGSTYIAVIFIFLAAIGAFTIVIKGVIAFYKKSNRYSDDKGENKS